MMRLKELLYTFHWKSSSQENASVNNKDFLERSIYQTYGDFEVSETSIGDICTVVPKDWRFHLKKLDDITYMGTITQELLNSNISIRVQKTEGIDLDYIDLKEKFNGFISLEHVHNLLEGDGNSSETVISDFESCEYKTSVGSAFKYSYQVSFTDKTLIQTLYHLNIDQYFVEVTSTDEDKLGLNAIAELALKSIRIIKN